MACSSRREIYQFKISSKRKHRPEIWRRIQVPSNYTFKQLHWAIRDSMGWKSKSSNFRFVAEKKMGRVQPVPEAEGTVYLIATGEKIVLPDFLGGTYVEVNLDEYMKLEDHFRRTWKKKMDYLCFNLCARHEVVLEEILPASHSSAYPKCVDGKGACPTEDCENIAKRTVRSVNSPSGGEFDPNSVIFMEGKIG